MSGDLPDLRASHADRDRVVDVLRVAAGDGRLSLDELESRVDAALSARTMSELASLTGIVVDTDELHVEFGKLKVRRHDDADAPALVRLELTGRAAHLRVVEQFVTAEEARRSRRA